MRFRSASQSPARPGLEPGSPAESEAVREAALKLLERRRRTRVDLARRLHEKGYASPAIEQVLDRLAGVGLVNDVEYARAFLSERWGRKAAGWRRLEQELRGRGIASEAIEEARESLETDVGHVDETTAARRVIQQAERRYARLDPRVRRQRLYALLGRRGFDTDVIRRALEIPEEPVSED